MADDTRVTLPRRGLACALMLACLLGCASLAHADDVATLQAPLDPEWSKQWYLEQPNDADIDLLEAWDTPSLPTGQGVTVAVVDTRVDETHPDLAENLLPTRDFVPGGCKLGKPTIDHGTQIAGLIAAVRDNGIGITGIAPDAKILPVRAFDDCGEGNIDTIAAALEHAAHRADIVVGSFATSPLLPADRKRAYQNRLSSLFERFDKTLFVFAAGNEGNDDPVGDPVYPCNTLQDGNPPPNLLCVGATDRNDAPICWSNRGAELYAPGAAAISTVWGGGYLATAGTSMSAAIVAGVAALLKGSNPGQYAAAELKDTLIGTADAGIPGLAPEGRVNAARALDSPSRRLGAGGPGKATPWTTCDHDHDGVPTQQDDCPNTPGLAEFRGCPDSDGDRVRDKDDNCPSVYNPDQADADGDGVGDACDPSPRGPDSDGDTRPNLDDRCPSVWGNGPDGCPQVVPPPRPPAPVPTPTVTPTGPSEKARVLSVRVRTTPKRCPRGRKTCSKTARVTVKMSRSAKLSLRIERRTKRKGKTVWRKVTTRSLKASSSKRSLTVRRLKPGSYRVIAKISGHQARRNFKV